MRLPEPALQYFGFHVTKKCQHETFGIEKGWCMGKSLSTVLHLHEHQKKTLCIIFPIKLLPNIHRRHL